VSLTCAANHWGTFIEAKESRIIFLNLDCVQWQQCMSCTQILRFLMKRKIYYIILITTLFFVSCHSYNTPEELKDKFYLNKKKFTSLTTKLDNDKKFDSLFHLTPYSPLPDLKDSYPTEFYLLNELDIASLTSQYGICKTCPRWYLLKTKWPSKHPVFLIYNENYYDSTENLKGFYKKDKYENETWGLGDNWKMFRFVDTIRDRKL
jgi:hypothetical protein